MLKQVEIFTDGSCLGNPGPGGYGAILRYRGKEKTFSEGFNLTTNNRMEMMAAIVALEALKEHCEVILSTDSLALARKMFPGKRNSLDALCSRYEIDNSKRTLHGALLDAQILADVYLMMTGGQTTMAFSMEGEGQRQAGDTGIQRVVRAASKLRVVYATDEELVNHESRLDLVQKKGGSCLWRA